MNAEVLNCEKVNGTIRLARAQGLPVEAVVCPQATVCDLKEPCPTSMVDVFNVRLEKTRALQDAKIGGQHFANGDKI